MSADPLDIQSLLTRPQSQRKIEFKYRCSQAIIFGLPVIALQYFGHRLAPGIEADRWIGILQALLAGWVVYVGAAGMLVEGLILLRNRFTFDLPIAVAAILFYLHSVISVTGVFVRGSPFYGPLLFHWAVIILAVWSGWRWWQFSR